MARSVNVEAGMTAAARAVAVPFTLGMRWARHGLGARSDELPPVRWTLGLVSKVVLDDIFFISELVSATFVSLGHRHRLASEIEGCLELYADRGWLQDPASYHQAPPPLSDVSYEDVSTAFKNHSHQRIAFESGYEPHVDEPGRERWLGREANRTGHAWLFEHPGEPRPWVVCVPGYRMGRPLIDKVGFRVKWLHRELGLNVAIPVMPLHGPRNVGRRNGDHFLSGDFVDTVHAQSQAVWDTRRLMGWLRGRGAPDIAVYGVSLGGYTAALLSSLDSDLDLSIIGIPATDFVALLESHMPDFAVSWAGRLGLPFDSLRQLLKVISPLAMPPMVPHDRRFLYAASVDGLAAPTQARELWRHWGRPRLDWYEGSHVSFLWEKKVERLVADALSAAGMIAPDAFAARGRARSMLTR
jgi:hypothetical protein